MAIRRDDDDSSPKKGVGRMRKQVLSKELMSASVRAKKPVVKTPVETPESSAKVKLGAKDKPTTEADDKSKKTSAKSTAKTSAVSEKAPVATEKSPSAPVTKPVPESPSAVPSKPAGAAPISASPAPTAKPTAPAEPKPLSTIPLRPVIERPASPPPSRPAPSVSGPRPVVDTRPTTSFANRPAPASPARPAPLKPAPAAAKPPFSPKPSAPKPANDSRVPKPVAVPVEAKSAPEEPELKTVAVKVPITVRDLATVISVKPTDLIASLMKKGVMATMNQSVGFEMASVVVKEFGFKIEEQHTLEADLSGIHHTQADVASMVTRPPIVTFMGHVDHGKTSLLDAIRKSKVVQGESGGITQHIGAYEVFLPKGAVTFLDTPGHEAFTAMRARGAQCTDIVVLVVAADSGVMPQTEEAIDHAKAAEVPIVVAINKCDLPAANVEKVKKELMEHELVPEDWGGKTICVPVSAKTGTGLERLLEMLLLESELLELKANPKAPARGSVVEAQMSKSSGPIVTLLIQDGTLRLSDFVVCGNQYGRVRAMINDHGQRIKEAPPSCPVEILGLSGVPKAGDSFYVVKDEAKAKELIAQKQSQHREKSLSGNAHVSLEQLYAQMQAGKVSQLRVVIKADTQGSIEALKSVLGQIPSDKIKLQIIHSATGDISRSDAMLATASDAIIIGFHVAVAADAVELIRQEQIDVRLYSIIYEVEDSLRKALEGMLEPEKIERHIATVEVRQVFKLSKSGVVAGSFVRKGKIVRSAICRVFRAGSLVREARIASLKRFKNDVREVQEGFECGVSLDGFSDFEPGDEIRAFEIESKASKL